VVTPQGNDTWEHKYNSMKGRHDRLETTNKHLTERVSGMEQTLAIMAANEPLPTAAPGQPASLLTPEETAEWGPELLDVVGRRAKEQFAPVIAGLEDQIKSLNERLQSVGGVMAQDARGRMLEDLTKVLPNWKEVNSNQNFLNWLVLPDTYSGAIRDQLLQAAYTANDTPRVLAFFNGFLAEEAALSPRTPAPDPTVVPDTARVPLESFAAPGRAKTAAAIDAPAEKPSFTRAQVATFYTDVARGSYRGRDDEKIAIERQISEAGREGRIK
jgi:hypothetical protein